MSDVELDPHPYTERSARARVERRREHGEELVMRCVDGVWYTGRLLESPLDDG